MALHPSLNPDVNSSERPSSRQHQVQWARPPATTGIKLYGKPDALKSYHCRVLQEPFIVSVTLLRPLITYFVLDCQQTAEVMGLGLYIIINTVLHLKLSLTVCCSY